MIPTSHCPAWCTAAHDPDEAPSDVRHVGFMLDVPVILGERGDGPANQPAAAELSVVLSQRADEAEAWLFIGEPDRQRQHLQLSPESAIRVARAVLANLDRLR